MLNDPTMLKYDTLEPNNAPKYGASVSPSLNFRIGSRHTVAWFVDLDGLKRFCKDTTMVMWDLETGKVVSLK